MEKRIDVNDLSRGERQYLARKGIRGREFDAMTPTAQREWKEEMKNPSYDRNDYDYKSQNNRYQY